MILLIFAVSATVMIVVSYLSEPPSLEKIRGLTFGTMTDEHRSETRSSWNWRDVAASATVLLAILAAYLFFSG